MLDKKLLKVDRASSLHHRLNGLVTMSHRGLLSKLHAFAQRIHRGATIDSCMLLSKTSMELLRKVDKQLDNVQTLQTLEARANAITPSVDGTKQMFRKTRYARYESSKSTGTKLVLRELEKLLVDVCSDFKVVYIVLDAFDEMDDLQQRKQFLHTLEQLEELQHVQIASQAELSDITKRMQ